MIHVADTDPAAAQARREGFLAAAPIGAALFAATADDADAEAVRTHLTREGQLRPSPPPSGRRRAATALADALLEEFLAGGVDLHRLAHRWLDWQEADGLDLDAGARASLDHLRTYDAPRDDPHPRGASVLAATLPAALASRSPGAMVSGAWHVARLLDPTPAGDLSAVAVVLAGSILLDGRRDFIPEVLSFLRQNEAGEEMLERFRAIPRDPRTPPPVPRGPEPGADVAATWILWQVHHRPRGAEVLDEAARIGNLRPEIGAVLAALLAARDGIASWPGPWLRESGEEVHQRRERFAQLGR